MKSAFRKQHQNLFIWCFFCSIFFVCFFVCSVVFVFLSLDKEEKKEDVFSSTSSRQDFVSFENEGF